MGDQLDDGVLWWLVRGHIPWWSWPWCPACFVRDVPWRIGLFDDIVTTAVRSADAALYPPAASIVSSPPLMSSNEKTRQPLTCTSPSSTSWWTHFEVT